MNERRQQPRHRASILLEVFERQENRCLGRIADLSREGFMLCGPEAPAVDTLVDCRLAASATIDAADDINLTADCLWVRPGTLGQPAWSGFRIVDIAPDHAQRLERLLKRLPTAS